MRCLGPCIDGTDGRSISDAFSVVPFYDMTPTVGRRSSGLPWACLCNPVGIESSPVTRNWKLLLENGRQRSPKTNLVEMEPIPRQHRTGTQPRRGSGRLDPQQ